MVLSLYVEQGTTLTPRWLHTRATLPPTCRQDPHFKAANHRRRIIQTTLLAEYAFIMAPGGILYTITDVEELGIWMVGRLGDEALGWGRSGMREGGLLGGDGPPEILMPIMAAGSGTVHARHD